jgi:FhuF 2Fe-2S C-terminal domain
MLDDLAGLGGFFAVGSHSAGAAPVPPWRPGDELLSASRPLMKRIASVRAALASQGGLAVDAVEPRVAASTVHLGLVARLASPALGAAVLGHPLDLRPRGLWWQQALGGPVPLSVPDPDPGGRAGGSGPAPGEWQRVLVDEVLAPATAAIARLVPVSGRVLRGNVASAVNAAARQLARQRPDLADGAWQAATGLFASPLLGSERQLPGPAFRRSSCCLYYRVAPGGRAGICGDCVLGARP